MNEGKRSATALRNGALVSASFGPPPMCRPMFSTLSSGSGRSGCLGSSTISGTRGATAFPGAGFASAVVAAECDDDGAGVADSAPVAASRAVAALGVPAAQPATLAIPTMVVQMPARPTTVLLTQEPIMQVITDFAFESIWFELPAECGRRADMRRPSCVARVARFARFPRFVASALLLGCAVGQSACDERGKSPAPAAPPKVVRSATTAASQVSASRATATTSPSKPAPDVLNVSELPDEA